jgi:protein-disulfide isomerase
VTPVATRVINAQVDGASMGDPNAPVKIDVWEDFQCPACKTYSEGTEPQVIDAYVNTGMAYYTFHQYPFIDGTLADRAFAYNGGESDHAANASLCAADQGRFWDYHDMLFANWNGENQNAFSIERLLAFGQSLDLNMDDFKACVESDQFKAQIEADYTMGQQWGNTGTPSVYVNGELVSPGYIPSFEQISAAVEAALAGQ